MDYDFGDKSMDELKSLVQQLNESRKDTFDTAMSLVEKRLSTKENIQIGLLSTWLPFFGLTWFYLGPGGAAIAALLAVCLIPFLGMVMLAIGYAWIEDDRERKKLEGLLQTMDGDACVWFLKTSELAKSVDVQLIHAKGRTLRFVDYELARAIWDEFEKSKDSEFQRRACAELHAQVPV